MPLRVALTGRSSGPDLPAQLQLLALAPGAVSDGVVVVGLEARMAELEQVLGTLPVPDATAAAAHTIQRSGNKGNSFLVKTWDSVQNTYWKTVFTRVQLALNRGP